MLAILVLLSIFRDKHEKKIASTYDTASLHIGRALLTPLVYVSFTILSLIDQSLVSFLTATAYQLGYLQFYFDQCKQLMTGIEPEDKERVLLFNREGRLNLTRRDLLQITGVVAAPSPH